MLDTERTFKIKVRSPWKVFEIFLTFCTEKRLSNFLKTTNFTKLTKAILERSFKVLQVASNGRRSKTSRLCFMDR